MDSPLAVSILEVVSQHGYRPGKPRAIAKTLGIPQEDVRLVKKAIKKLIKEGKLSWGPDHKVTLPSKSNSKYITGVFRRALAGFGFVRPAGAPRGSRDGIDIYIPKKNSLDAASGDTVLVLVGDKRGKGGNREGKITEIVERETHQFVGTYLELEDNGLVQIDGTVFTQPILVGDAGAKGVSVNDKVVIEMVRFPSHFHEGEGVITEVLGAAGDPGVETLSVIREFNLPGEFAEDAMEAAREQAEIFDETITGTRRDLRDTTVITIDPEDARDFDDAISLKQIENGHWLLGVHIADVTHFVQKKTALDRESHNRATSVYLPDRVIPMLPEIISNNLASLQPNRVRYTMTAFIEFTAEGVHVGTDICRGAIESDRRFTYEEVDDFLADRDQWKEKLAQPVFNLLADMHHLAMILRRRRFNRGSLELHMPEVKVDLDKEGRVTGASLQQNTESHQIIEEFMLVANEAVARRLHEHDHAFLRRVHEPPDPRKLKALTEFVKELGLDVGSLESRFELQGLLDRVKNRPESHAVNYAVLRSLQKAVYSPEPEGHFALASECYCHFTSPIRRYPDLTVHRLLGDMIDGRTPEAHMGEIVALGDHCSEREQRAEKAERELTKVKLLLYLQDRIGEEMDAVITGVQEFGLFARGIKLPAEGLIHVSSLEDDFYRFEKQSHSLTGFKNHNSYRLGDTIRVAVAKVDVDRRELDFRLISRIGGRRSSESEQSQGNSPKKTKGGRSGGKPRKFGAKKKKSHSLNKRSQRKPGKGKAGKKSKSRKKK